jgi:hypothetical protein
MRRLLTVTCIAVLMGTSTACGSSDGGSSNNTAAPSTAACSASPSPTVDVKANTAEVCDKAKKLLDTTRLQGLGLQIGLLIKARSEKNAAAEAQAKAEIKAQTDQLAKDLNTLKAEAVDPKLQSALGKATDGVTMLGTDAYLAKLNTAADVQTMTKDLAAAGADLDATCT